jgi:pSer/pThr/pTyr-binding forkhead associated (FHA) protein
LTSRSEPRRFVPAMAVRFVVRSRDGHKLQTELAFSFDQSRIVLGRAGSVDVRIPSPTVSETHASVQLRGSDWVVSDMASRNGTKHNGQRLLPERTRKLQDGDVLELGNYVLTFHTNVVVTEPMSAERTAELARRLWREAQSARGRPLEAPRLTVVNGPRAGERLEIPAAPSRSLIGSYDGCQLVIPEPTLAREALEVVHDLEGVQVRCLSGEALIQLSGNRFMMRRLRDRDELQVGTTRMLFEEPAQGAIDALKGAPDVALPSPEQEQPSQTLPEPRGRSEPARDRKPSAPPNPPQQSGGPSLAELLIYTLAIAVLAASALALALLLRAR